MHSRWFQRLLRAGVCLAVVIVGSTAQAMSEASRFPGAWRLVSAEYRAADGTIVDSPWGPEPQGMLIYDSYGHMAAQIGRRDRPAFAGGDQLRGSAEEVRAAFETYNAYWGRYEVDEHARTVTHHVEQAMFPNWIGTKQLRYYKLEATRLILSTPPIRRGGQEVTGVLVWERMR